jgi:AcrR family transcriptional regulator
MSAADTRQRILAIAADLFARQGYTATTIADIARELGTTTAALYYHFPSKADILAGLLAEPLIAYTRIIESLDANQPEPAELLGAFIDLAVDSRAMAGLIDRDPAVLAMIDERLPRTSRQTTEQVIAVLAGPDADRSAVIRAHAALAVIKGATMAALELDDGALEPAEREEILQLALGVLSGSQPDQASVGLPPLLPRFARSQAVTRGRGGGLWLRMIFPAGLVTCWSRRRGQSASTRAGAALRDDLSASARGDNAAKGAEAGA